MRRWPLGLLSLLAASVPAGAQAPSGRPSPAVIRSALPSVFKVLADDCRSGAGSRAQGRRGTGFAVDVDGTTRLITDLHVVAGCQKLRIEDQQGNRFEVTQGKIRLAEDLALLQNPRSDRSPAVTLQAPPLRLSTRTPQPGEELTVLGYGKTPTPQDKDVRIRAASGATGRADTLTTLIENGATLHALQQQGFPSVDAPILSIQGGIFGGDSGGPIVDAQGAVVGVANGGLKGGMLFITWGFPASAIGALVRSDLSKLPSTSVLCDSLLDEELLAEELPSAPLPNSEPPQVGARSQRKDVRCGSALFTLAAEQTFEKALASADPLSQQHAAMAQMFALKAGKVIPPNKAFEIYLHGPSGATFSIPKGFTLRTVGTDCVARDPQGELEIRAHAEQLSNFLLNAASDGFIFRALDQAHGEQVLANPNFSMMAPIQRADGMIVRRTAGLMGTLPMFQMNRANEMYATHVFRNGTYMGVLVRTLAPNPALRANDFYAALVSVYLSAFSF